MRKTKFWVSALGYPVLPTMYELFCITELWQEESLYQRIMPLLECITYLTNTQMQVTLPTDMVVHYVCSAESHL